MPKITPGARRAGLLGLALGASMTLAACGGGGGGGSSSGDTGTLTLGITDAPPIVGDVVAINVVVTAISVKPEDGEPVTFECGTPEFDCDIPDDLPKDRDDDPNTRTIDLKQLTGEAQVVLLDGVELEAGLYEWIRLHLDAAPPSPGGTGASKVVFEGGGEEDLAVPSGVLKFVSGFLIPADGSADFTVDVQLRRGLKRTGSGVLMLRPAHRLIDNNRDGVLRGEVDPNFLVDGVAVSDPACGLPAVYVYEAEEFMTAGQVGSENEPETDELLEEPEMGSMSGNYTYEVGFLEAGDYKVAIACSENDGDEPDDADVLISDTQDATVTIGGDDTVVNFFP